MIILYDNPFSPFARKVRMALQFKEVPYESIGALALAEHARLRMVKLPEVGPACEPTKDEAYIRRVFIDSGAVARIGRNICSDCTASGSATTTMSSRSSCWRRASPSRRW
jgi:hypothetical protein